MSHKSISKYTMFGYISLLRFHAHTSVISLLSSHSRWFVTDDVSTGVEGEFSELEDDLEGRDGEGGDTGDGE